MTQPNNADHPRDDDFPPRRDIARERVKRIAAIAAQCGEIIPRGALHSFDLASSEDEEVLVRDDIDAATRFFDAAQHDRVDAEEDASSESAGGASLDFTRYRARRIRGRLLALLQSLLSAIERRDLDGVWTVLDEAEACRCFPPAVREEALVIARLPTTSFRAPIRLYRYHYLLSRLGDEPLEVAMDPAQLTIDLAPPTGSPPVRELHFPDRSTPGDGPPHGGGVRRRTSSR